jgi:anti-anti-sigma regulatory factor
VVLAGWTSLTLRFGLFQHPRLVRQTYRIADAVPGGAWTLLRDGIAPHEASVKVERRRASTVWVRLEGSITRAAAERFAARLRTVMARKKERVILDLGRVAGLEEGAAHGLAEGLKAYRHRIRVVLPRVGEFAAIAAAFTPYR